MKVKPANGVMFVEQTVALKSGMAQGAVQGVITHVCVANTSKVGGYLVGQKVLYNNFAGQDITLHDKTYTALCESDVIAILIDEEPERNKGFEVTCKFSSSDYSTMVFKCLDCGLATCSACANELRGDASRCYACGNSGPTKVKEEPEKIDKDQEIRNLGHMLVGTRAVDKDRLAAVISRLEEISAAEANDGPSCHANLGYATTRQLIDEITARIEINGNLDYRTVGDEESDEPEKPERNKGFEVTQEPNLMNGRITIFKCLDCNNTCCRMMHHEPQDEMRCYACGNNGPVWED